MKRANKADPPPATRRRGARRLVSVALTLGFAVLVLFGLSVVGDAARRNIGPRDRYAVRFADIRCGAPPNTTRETFLVEVRYAANAEATFQSLDTDLKKKLTTAFAAHPWVANVDAVTIVPPNEVTVALTFRIPVLAIPRAGGDRALDVKGVLLPTSAQTDSLPRLLNAPTLPPNAVAGQPWPDDAVVRAAPVAAEYKPLTIERTQQGWELILPNNQKLVVAK